MIIVNDDLIQGTFSWLQARAGRPSASGFDRVITTKGERSKQAQDYMLQLAGESIVGMSEPSYTNAAMIRGTELEAEARQYYEIVRGVEVRQVGLIYADESRRVLCSPDGLLENSGLEIKCPMMKTHVKYLLDGKLPYDYFQQVQGSMWVTGFDTWNFLSYYPGLPQLDIVVHRDEKWCESFSVIIGEFLEELQTIVDKLRGMI